MPAFLSSLLGKIALPLALAGTVLAITFYVMWSSASSDLTETQSALTGAQTQVATLTEERNKLLEDIELRSRLNSDLNLEVGTITLRHTQEVAELNDRIRELEKTRSKRTIVINNTGYIEEKYLEEVSSAINDELWKSYCKTSLCEGVVP